MVQKDSTIYGLKEFNSETNAKLEDKEDPVLDYSECDVKNGCNI
jgi:hypothetical protein